jgi:hypothetical protein
MKITTIILIVFFFSASLIAQEKKGKTYQQSRSAETGRYVTKKEAKSNPRTTYTTTRQKKQ